MYVLIAFLFLKNAIKKYDIPFLDMPGTDSIKLHLLNDLETFSKLLYEA